MTRLAALVLVACSSPAHRTPEPPRRPDPPLVPTHVPVAEQPPIPTPHTLRDVAEAPHGGAIQTLAMSPDGTAVLSADELGGVRLWPDLSGKHEPRVVDMPAAKQLALGKRDGGWIAVALDEVGGLYIAKLDDSGRQLAHTTIPAEPAITGMVMTARGLLAWRSDQTIVLLDADGATLDKLGTDAGQRILMLAHNNKRVVALLRRDGTPNHVRWLTLEPKLAWGAWIKLQEPLTGEIDFALSPSGKQLAVIERDKNQQRGHMFELPGGKHRPLGALKVFNADLGFVDDKQLAFGGFEGIAWLEADKPDGLLGPLNAGSGTRTQPALATGGGVAVSAMNGDLVVATPKQTQYLGYDTVSPRIAEIGSKGQVLVGVAEHAVLLDADLKEVATPITGQVGMMAELRWLGDDEWLMESTAKTGGGMNIAIVDANGKQHEVRKNLKEVQVLQYEPSTQLVTLSFGAASEVARYDRKSRALVEVSKLARPSPYEQVLFMPVSPKLAGGTQLVQITMRDRTTIKWLRDARALDKAASTLTLDGSFAGADAAGHVYIWRNTTGGQLELAIYRDGKPLHTLPNTGAVALWPEPAGGRYVEVAPSSVAMYSVDGKQLWFQQLAAAHEALWLSDGALAVISAGGIARLDPQTGGVVAARCGWRFGLAAKPHPPAPRVEPLCSQLRR